MSASLRSSAGNDKENQISKSAGSRNRPRFLFWQHAGKRVRTPPPSCSPCSHSRPRCGICWLGVAGHTGPHTSARPLAMFAPAASLWYLLAWRRRAYGAAHLRPPLAMLAPVASLWYLLAWRRRAYGSAHLSLAARHARAGGLAVRVRPANCIPQLRRFALRAGSAGGMAVSLPSSR